MSDGAGLCLWVTTAEGKLWRWGCKSDGKNKITSYRKYPDIGLAKAKELQGRHPAHSWQPAPIRWLQSRKEEGNQCRG
jgi:hypothetical protein